MAEQQKEIKTVYVLTVTATIESEVLPIKTKVYSNLSEGYEAYQKEIDEALIDTSGNNWQVEEGKDYWETYSDGDYANNHIYVAFTKEEVV